MNDTLTVQMARSRVAKNSYQGAWPRILCVCSAGLLRSPTLALVLSQPPYNCNTRAVGSDKEYALIPIDQILVDWAEAVVFVNRENYERVVDDKLALRKHLILSIPDSYACRDPELIKEIERQLEGFSDWLRPATPDATK